MTDAPEVGAVYVVADDDYRFGLGALRVDVTKVIGGVHFGESGKTELWWHVRGACKPAHDSGDWEGQERELYIRASALRRSRRWT